MDHANQIVDNLYDTLLEHSSSDTAYHIAYGEPLCDNPTAEEKTAWVHHVMHKMEATYDEQTIKAIRTCCYCDEGGQLQKSMKWLKGLYDASSDIHDFINKVNEHGAGWYVKDCYLYTKYLDCSCPMLEGIDRLESKTWCYCTMGYTRAIFSHVFDCPFDEVDIELLKAIKMGDEFCLMRVALPK